MRTSSTRSGFTLIEVLVVVLIVGIVLSIAALALRHDVRDDLETEGRRLTALITLAAQEAVLAGREIAVAFTPRGYRFLVLTEGQWTDPDDPVFRRRDLPDGLSLDIAVDGQAYDFLGEEGSDPRILLLSSGEMTPFEITLRHRNGPATLRIRGDINGKLEFTE